MFTGIIETTGKILSLESNFLTIDASTMATRIRRGGSIAVDGVCLTSLGEGGRVLKAEVMPETLKRTTLGNLKHGDEVNLELALGATDRLDGHIVQGHVDGIGTIKTIESYGNSTLLTIHSPEALNRYIVEKGSIAINGISLTVIAADLPSPEGDDPHLRLQFKVGIIPHTWQVTALHRLHVGDKVNIETDILAKYIEKWFPEKSL
ncbi:riboflavin synthase [Candidatus Peregrinibacteria bacterium]|nr:riboflavin synthase [Candidatus Peregrinibacteria bacterium]